MDKTTSLGLGTAALGRPQYINIRKKKLGNITISEFKQNSFKVLDKAYDLGVRYFDTAPGYGIAEELLLNWLEQKKDKSIQIGTKWGYTYVANFKHDAKQHEIKEHSIEKLNEQWQFSKKLLPYFKFYQIHSATFETGVLNNKTILKRLAQLKEEYGIAIGITTTGSNQVDVIKKALEVTVDGNFLFDTFQCTYNILDQSITPIITILKKYNKTLIIKEALANGRVFPNTNYADYKPLYTYLIELSSKYKVGIDAIALQFCVQNINPEIVLSGASTTMQIQENSKYAKIALTMVELEKLKTFKIPSTNYWAERKALNWN